jgi:hypothetical protein
MMKIMTSYCPYCGNEMQQKAPRLQNRCNYDCDGWKERGGLFGDDQWQKAYKGEPLTPVYTLPVVDNDGAIAGKRGKVIVSSRELILRAVINPEQIEVGEAVKFPQAMGNLPGAMYVAPNGFRFDRVTVTRYPNPRGDLLKDETDVFDVWVRSE